MSYLRDEYDFIGNVLQWMSKGMRNVPDRGLAFTALFLEKSTVDNSSFVCNNIADPNDQLSLALDLDLLKQEACGILIEVLIYENDAFSSIIHLIKGNDINPKLYEEFMINRTKSFRKNQDNLAQCDLMLSFGGDKGFLRMNKYPKFIFNHTCAKGGTSKTAIDYAIKVARNRGWIDEDGMLKI